jgi:hypothetical protein
MSSGIFPSSLKIAKVIPVFKNGDHSNFSNYRPISILPSFSKIFEKIIVERLNHYINSNNLHFDNQFGFRKNHSTYMAVHSLTNTISAALDHNELAVALFIDLSKAFDTIDHGLLFRKLCRYGIRGIPLKLIESYLNERYQCVLYNNCYSNYLKITCGVPQGSILGPLLFLLYVNDVNSCSSVLKFIMFADDTTIIITGKSWPEICSTLNRELMLLFNWFCINRLSLNVQKTNCMAFGNKFSSSPTLNIKIDDKIVTQVTSTKFLGVEIDNKLSWKLHIAKVEQKVSSIIGVISKIRYKLNKEISLLLYKTLIFPHLYYCSLLWAGNYKTAVNKIFVLQKRAIRICTLTPKFVNSTSLFINSNILSIFSIYKYQLCSMMFSVYNNLLPNVITKDFQKVGAVHSYNTRQKGTFYHQFSSLNVRKFSAVNAGPILWESIPSDIRNKPHLYQFKRALKSYLLSTQY